MHFLIRISILLFFLPALITGNRIADQHRLEPINAAGIPQHSRGVIRQSPGSGLDVISDQNLNVDESFASQVTRSPTVINVYE